MCHHRTVAHLAGGSDVAIQVRDGANVRTILVRGFPANLCSDCKAILPDLAWELAVEHALEDRLAHGMLVADIESFAALGVTTPALLCA